MKTVAVILAGGKGNRVGGDLPKQFLLLKDKTVVEYSICAFSENESIDEVCIVCHKDYMQLMQRIVKEGGYRKVAHIIEGGKERSDSTRNALKLYSDEDILLIHDAARPFVSQRIINDCIAATRCYNAVNVAIATTDTIIVADSDNYQQRTLDRRYLRNVQTPQAFRCMTLRQAYEKALADEHFTATDDCGTVNRYLPEETIYIVEGEADNLKITYSTDLQKFQQL